jgi:hypothetical protein
MTSNCEVFVRAPWPVTASSSSSSMLSYFDTLQASWPVTAGSPSSSMTSYCEVFGQTCQHCVGHCPLSEAANSSNSQPPCILNTAYLRQRKRKSTMEAN